MSKVTEIERVIAWSDSRGISKQEPFRGSLRVSTNAIRKTHTQLQHEGVSGYVLNKLEELQEYCEATEENDRIDAIGDSMIYDMTEMLKEGYDISKVFNEVLIVIESRTGHWDDKLGKFVKDSSKEALARRYKPDYVKNCKQKTLPKSLFGHGKHE